MRAQRRRQRRAFVQSGSYEVAFRNAQRARRRPHITFQILNIRWTRATFRVLASAYDPGSGQPGAPSSSGARAGRPRPKHGALLRPVDRADPLRGIRPRTPLGAHRRRRAGADRLAPVSASRPSRTGEVAQPQEAPRLRAPGLTASFALREATMAP